jgi:glycogen debranching enzyme
LKKPRLFSVCLIFLITSIFSHAQQTPFSLNTAANTLDSIVGKKANSEYLYTTAGDRLYCIGNQAGHFPPVGFHVPGEMGGIWQQPIKLMDGFSFRMNHSNNTNASVAVCEKFITYPFLTKFIYSVPGTGLRVAETQMVPDGLPVLVVEYTIQNNSSQTIHTNFEWRADMNLMPVWLSERLHIEDGVDRIDSAKSNDKQVIFKDAANSWYAGIGSDLKTVGLKSLRSREQKAKCISGIFETPIDLDAGKSMSFRLYISGSTKNAAEVKENISQVESNLPTLFAQKKNRFEGIETLADIRIPDTLLQTAYRWGKYNTDWLRRDVPGFGKGLSAGLPDYPWFFSNDQANTFMALTGTVSPKLFYDAFTFLKSTSDRVNDKSGRIIHEVSMNGEVYNKGNMQESQLHIMAAWQIFKWTGNKDFLLENYHYAKRIWTWLQQHDTNHNGYIEGYGGVEIEGLNDEMLDVQIATYRFLDILSEMAGFFGDSAYASAYKAKAVSLKEKINKEWWVDTDSCYADFLSSPEKALHIINNALAKRVNPDRNKWALKKLTDLKESVVNNTYPYPGYSVYYNAAMLGPVIEGMTDTLRALKMLKRVAFFTNTFGMYIAGIERPDDVSVDERPFKKDSTFTYNRAVMPAATAGLIIANARYGSPDSALVYIHEVLNTFNFATPGTTYEVSPDYGMFVQAWNVSCFNIPLIQYFFGVDPDAYRKEITIHLRMPDKWKEASLNNLLVGNTKISIHYRKENGIVYCEMKSSEPGWKLRFIRPSGNDAVILNNKKLTQNDQVLILSY